MFVPGLKLDQGFLFIGLAHSPRIFNSNGDVK